MPVSLNVSLPMFDNILDKIKWYFISLFMFITQFCIYARLIEFCIYGYSEPVDSPKHDRACEGHTAATNDDAAANNDDAASSQ